MRELESSLYFSICESSSFLLSLVLFISLIFFFLCFSLVFNPTSVVGTSSNPCKPINRQESWEIKLMKI